MPVSESDLYLPVKRFLELQGYEVKGEVGDCDVAAVRGDEELVVVELKLSLNLELVLQAVERLAVTSKVYVGVPVGNHNLRRRRRQTVKLLRMLGLGLLVIDPDVERHGVDTDLPPIFVPPAMLVQQGQGVEQQAAQSPGPAAYSPASCEA